VSVAAAADGAAVVAVEIVDDDVAVADGAAVVAVKIVDDDDVAAAV